MGIKVVYKNNKPPYGTIYEYHEKKLALVCRKGSISVRQLSSAGTFPVVLEPVVLGEGFYQAIYNAWDVVGPKTKSWFYVDADGDVLEFERETHWRSAFARHNLGDPDWYREGKWLVPEGPEPAKRKIARDPEPLTRFERIADNREIVPDLKPPPPPKAPAPPKKKATDDDLVQALNDAMGKEEAKPKTDMGSLVDDFLKGL